MFLCFSSKILWIRLPDHWKRCRDFSKPDFSQPDLSQLQWFLIKFQPCKSWQSPVRIRGRVRYILGSYPREKNGKIVQKISVVAKSRRTFEKYSGSLMVKLTIGENSDETWNVEWSCKNSQSNISGKVCHKRNSDSSDSKANAHQPHCNKTAKPDKCKRNILEMFAVWCWQLGPIRNGELIPN